MLQNDSWDAAIGLSQLTPWGGVVDFGLSGSYNTTNSTFVDVNPAIPANLFFGINQPLLRNFGRIPTELNIMTSRNTRDASYQAFVRSVQTVINSVEQSYWDLVYARANLAVKLEARDIARELNRITKIKIDVGSLAPIDIVQTEVGIATAEQDIITADALVGLAEDRLRRDLNYQAESPTTVRVIPTDDLGVQQRSSFDLAEGVRTALTRRPEIIAQNYTVDSNTLRYEYWQNQTLPQLDLVAGYGKNGLGGTQFDTQTGQIVSKTNWWDAADQLFSENFKDWRVGIVFSYPIFNRTARGARGVAQFNLETSKANLTVLEQDIVLNVRDAHRVIGHGRAADRRPGEGPGAGRAQPRCGPQEVRQRHDDLLRGLADPGPALGRPVAVPAVARGLPEGRVGVPQRDRRHPRVEERAHRRAADRQRASVDDRVARRVPREASAPQRAGRIAIAEAALRA